MQEQQVSLGGNETRSFGSRENVLWSERATVYRSREGRSSVTAAESQRPCYLLVCSHNSDADFMCSSSGWIRRVSARIRFGESRRARLVPESQWNILSGIENKSALVRLSYQGARSGPVCRDV